MSEVWEVQLAGGANLTGLTPPGRVRADGTPWHTRSVCGCYNPPVASIVSA